MLFDRPASFLYRHGRNLYMPLRIFAPNYCAICRLGVALAVLWLTYDVLADRSLMTLFGVFQPPR